MPRPFTLVALQSMVYPSAFEPVSAVPAPFDCRSMVREAPYMYGVKRMKKIKKRWGKIPKRRETPGCRPRRRSASESGRGFWSVFETIDTEAYLPADWR